MSKRRTAHEPPQGAQPGASSAVQQSPPVDLPGALLDLPVSPPPESSATSTGDPNAGPSHKRAGVDTRQRGWYWHWNGIVTQYAPLIGLKGVGLLNSYTVWTDRREQSPTRGYAFPSQQSEADFYGEDRSELITINKILVALDLIEIRKEMVLRTDPRGRGWKVPHNLYRVKDRPDGIELCTADVLRVAELASRDAAVFRYLKRIFSARFSPIDRDNVWRQILTEVAGDPVWRSLTDKTAKIDARASARTRAGHQARNTRETAAPLAPHPNGGLNQTDGVSSARLPADPVAIVTAGQIDCGSLGSDEQGVGEPGRSHTSVAGANKGSGSQRSDVAAGNTGFAADVDAANTGLKGEDESSAEASNTGPASVVAPGNATYHQEMSTTTTTTTGAKSHDRDDEGHAVHPEPEGPATHDRPAVAAQHDETDRVVDTGQAGLDDHTAALSPGAGPAPDRESGAPPERDLADPRAGGPLVDPGTLVVSLFEAANDRRASPLERTLLAELERDADPAARANDESGSDWVAAALREAVASGSAFVAPKRVREIINRWAAAGNRPQLDRPAAQPSSSPAHQPPHMQRSVPVHLPLRRNATRVWQAVLEDLGRVLDVSTHERLLRGSRIVGYQRGAVLVEVNAGAAEKLAAEYRPLLERQLERHIGKAVMVQFTAATEPQPEVSSPQSRRVEISRSDAEQGRQLWRAVLSEIAPSIGADDLARLRGAMPLGQDGEGHIVIGAPTSLAVRLLDSRCRAAVEAALCTLLGGCVTLRVAGSDEWSVVDERSEG